MTAFSFLTSERSCSRPPDLARRLARARASWFVWRASRSISEARSWSSTVISSASARARRARSARTWDAAWRSNSAVSSAGSCPEASRYWSTVKPRSPRRLARASAACCAAWATRVGGISSTTRSARASTARSRTTRRASSFFRLVSRPATSRRSSSRVSNSEASEAHSSVASGSTFSRTCLTSTRRLPAPPCKLGASTSTMSPAFLPRSCSSTPSAIPPVPTS